MTDCNIAMMVTIKKWSKYNGGMKSIVGMLFCMALFFGAVWVVNGATATVPSSGAGESLFTPRYLPNIIQGAKGPADMIFFLYKYLMGLVGIVAVGVIMYAGVLHTVSADIGKIKQSNEYIKNALKGIVLLFGVQVLFNTINPNIVDFPRIQEALQPKERFVPVDFTWSNTGAPEDTTPTNPLDAESESGAKALYGNPSRGIVCATGQGTPPNNCTGGTVDLADKIQPCDGCVAPDFGGGNSFAVKPTACFGGASKCLLSTPLVGALNKLQNSNQAWRLTEGYPPTVNHGSSCHFNGTCADIGFTGDVTSATVNKLINDAQSAGLTVINEGGAGINPQTFATTRGAHLHVRL